MSIDKRLADLERALQPDEEAFSFTICTPGRHVCDDERGAHFTFSIQRAHDPESAECD